MQAGKKINLLSPVFHCLARRMWLPDGVEYGGLWATFELVFFNEAIIWKEIESQWWADVMEAFIIDPAKLIGDIVGEYFWKL